MLPANVRYSDWNCRLESEDDACRSARAERPFHNAQDLANRPNLDRHELVVLAKAAALRGLAGHHH